MGQSPSVQIRFGGQHSETNSKRCCKIRLDSHKYGRVRILRLIAGVHPDFGSPQVGYVHEILDSRDRVTAPVLPDMVEECESTT